MRTQASRRWISGVAALLTAALLVAGCGDDAADETASDDSSTTSTTSTTTAPDAESGSEVPEGTAPIPDGEYRVEITVEEVADFGVSNEGGFTGTWTMAVSEGTFELRCAAIDLPNKDCGNGQPQGTAVFEVGYLRGDDTTVYFVGDGELAAAATGCKLPASEAPDHCFVLDPYWLDWKVDGEQLTFTDAGGPEQPTFVIKPWTKIS